MAKYSIVSTMHNGKIDVISNISTSVERADIYRIIFGKAVDEKISESRNNEDNCKRIAFLGKVPVESLLRQCAKEESADKMVQRVLKPVIWMIRDGLFDHPAV